MRCCLSGTDSSVLYLTRGGESSEDIFSGLKKITEKSMKILNPIRPKKIKLGIMTVVKWTITKIANI
jgi:hypothetical protein